MARPKPLLTIVAALVVALAGAGAVWLADPSARAATSTLCQEQTSSVGGGTYTVQNNEYDSGASECVTTDGNADFTVANSGVDNATDGSPGAYPSIYQGCHWGNCSAGGLTSSPIEVSNLTTGKVTTSWSTTQPGGSNAYDVAYDIWFNQTPTTSGQPDCTELMVWLNHDGSVQPFGSTIASDVTVGGNTYNIWEGAQSTWDTITYDMTSGTTSVTNLDIGTLAQDAVSRGYLPSSCYLIDVEAGFELWQGGAGLATNSFSVNIAGSTPASPSAPATPSASPSPSASPTGSPSASPSAGSAPCSAVYSLVNSWSGGFQGQVVVTNTGSSTLNGWVASWTFPGDQQITDLWNGSDTQSGEAVTVSNVSYDGTLAPGGTATIGFTASYTGSNNAPPGLSCT
jgi:Glycosyl hydrolase family 12/Cellulose binding domain